MSRAMLRVVLFFGLFPLPLCSRRVAGPARILQSAPATPSGTSNVNGVFVLLVLLVLAACSRVAAAQEDALRLLRDQTEALARAFASQLSTLPSPSAGAFTFTFDPELGVPKRSTESLGPILSDRVETIGRNRVTLFGNYTRNTPDEVDGVNLRSVRVALVERSPSGAFVSLAEVGEDASVDIFNLGALYGVTDRLDIGITIPVIRTQLTERRRFIGDFLCPPNFADVVRDCAQIRQGAALPSHHIDSTGIGDILLRGKYRLWQAHVGEVRLGLGGTLDLTVPTGQTGEVAVKTVNGEPVILIDEAPRGIGVARVKPRLLLSGSWFAFSARINLGAELGKTEGITNDFVYAVGVDYTVARRVTLVADLLGRHAFSVERLRFARLIGRNEPAKKASSDTVDGSFGIKVNPTGRLVLFLNVLVPFNETGVRDDITPSVGLEWSF